MRESIAMLSMAARIFLANTVIAPLFLTYGWAAYRNGDRTTAIILVAACAMLACACLGLLRSTMENFEHTRFEVISTRHVDGIEPVFLLLYLLPPIHSSIQHSGLAILAAGRSGFHGICCNWPQLSLQPFTQVDRLANLQGRHQGRRMNKPELTDMCSASPLMGTATLKLEATIHSSKHIFQHKKT